MSYIRPYQLTGGRTEPRRAGLGPETLVRASGSSQPSSDVIGLIPACRTPRSIAELSGLLDVPMGALAVVVTDLEADGHLTLSSDGPGNRPSRHTMERLLDALRSP